MIILRKYNAATHIYVPIIKRAAVDFAVSADWTPAAGDVKISKDGGAAANVTNLPTAIAMGNTAVWDFSITAAELSAAQVAITVADAAAKAVEDQTILIDTYGNASARHAVDLNDSVRAGLTALPNAAAEAAGGLYTRGVGAGQVNQDANGRVDTRWVAGNVTVGTNNDKTGYTLTAAEYTALVNAIWDELTSEGRTAGSYGQKLKDLLVDGSGRITVGALANAVITAAAHAADAIDANALASSAADEIAAKILLNPGNKLFTFGAGSVITGQNDDKEQVLISVLEGTLTVAQVLRIMLAAMAGKANSFPAGPVHYRNQADTKDRITATVDADGNRTVVAVDGI